MAEPEDEDNFPNDYDGLDFDNIPGLQAPTATTSDVSVPRHPVPFVAASPVPSTESNSTEDIDSSFLAAVDALEARALSETPRGTELLSCSKPDVHPTTCKISDSPQGEGTRNSNQVHQRFMHPPELPSMSRMGKRKAESQEDMNVRSILAEYEAELTCPICCDLLVGAQVANPCGHTCCGECGFGWLARSKYEPTCAVCRTALSVRKPLLPNFSVDSLVRRHLHALARSGRPEWQEKGYRTIEWNKRLESWKKQAAIRAAKEKARPRRRQPRYYELEEYSYAAQLTDESMDDAEEAIVTRVLPRRGTRSRR